MEARGHTNRLLVVDDDVEFCAIVAEYLGTEGFDVEAVHTGEDGAKKALSGDYVLVVLDVMLPKMSGFQVLQRIRARSQVPVLMLTARGEDVDRIVGLELGADDYVPKPYNARELVARIRTILRRTMLGESLPPAERMVVADIELDTGTHMACCQGKPIDLTAMEFSLLAALLRRPGQIVKREELFQEVLGRDFQPYDRSLDVHVSNLRKKLGREVARTERIKAIRGVGYVYSYTGPS